MIAAAMAGADVVDVAIDSMFSTISYETGLIEVGRHVRSHLSTVDGCSLHGLGANHSWHRYPIR